MEESYNRIRERPLSMMSEVSNAESIAETALPEVVSKLFMLDNTFFRSPFLRDKLPTQLFSNGSDGFGRFFDDFGTSTPSIRSARSSYYPPERYDDDEIDRDSEGPPTPTINFSNSHDSGSSVFDFRRSSEPSATIVRNIPIRVEPRQMNNMTTNYSQTPTPSQPPVNNGMPNYVRQSSYPTAGVVPSGQAASSYLSRSKNDDLNKGNEGSDAYSLRSFNFPSEERANLANANNSIGTGGSNGLYATIRRTKSSGRVSPFSTPLTPTVVPEPPQRRSFSHLLQPYRQPTTPTSSSTLPQPTNSASAGLSSIATLQPPPPTHIAPPPPSANPVIEAAASSHFSDPHSYPYHRPTSPMSQKSRPKSPSLQSLRAGFRKATTCVRRHENDGSDGESEFRAAVPSGSTSTSSLYATINRPKPNPSPLRHTSTSRTMEQEFDAVEEAIRSLESFDPHKIIADAAATAANNRRESAVSGSDSDTGSVLLRSSDARTSESPTTSSGIVADMIHESPQRSSTISNRSSTEGTSSSSSDSGSHIISVEPVPLYGNVRFTSSNALPQPPAVARIAHSGSFGPNPQRAIVSSPNATLTRASNRSKPITIDATSVVTPTASPMLPIPRDSVQQAQFTNDTDFDEADEAATMRKRMLCAQMTDCAKVIEINGLKMSQYTSAPNWRHPHLLARNVPNIQDTVYIIEAALDELLEFTQRVSIPRHDPKHAELIRLVAPLHTSQALIHRLRTNLDAVAWSIGALSRVPGMPYVSDSLDQFVAILHQLPKDCRQLVQWTYMLGPTIRINNEDGAQFLPRGSPGASPFPVATPVPRELLIQAAPEHRSEVPNEIPQMLAPRGYGLAPPAGQPIHRLSPVPSLRPPTVEEIAMDGGESTTSSNGSSATEVPSPGGTTPTQSTSLSNNRGEILEEDDLSSIADSTRQVYEEDDLASVMSDTSSLYQDYSLLDGAHGSLPRSRAAASRSKLNPLFLKDLSEEERELLRFYAPQLDTHTQGLCRLIDEFFAVVEQAEAPAKFVQKVRLIILEAQTLVYIGDNMAQCVATPGLRAEFRHASDRLNNLRTQCVNYAKVAKEQYPSVPAVKAMMNSVIAVSDAAQNLKQLGKACA